MAPRGAETLAQAQSRPGTSVSAGPRAACGMAKAVGELDIAATAAMAQGAVPGSLMRGRRGSGCIVVSSSVFLLLLLLLFRLQRLLQRLLRRLLQLQVQRLLQRLLQLQVQRQRQLAASSSRIPQTRLRSKEPLINVPVPGPWESLPVPSTPTCRIAVHAGRADDAADESDDAADVRRHAAICLS